MKRLSILVLILVACFAPVALAQQPAGNVHTKKVLTNWNEFHRPNMRRWNPYENVLNVNNVGSLSPEVDLQHRRFGVFFARSRGWGGLCRLREL